MRSNGDGPDAFGKDESGSSPIFPAALTSPVNWLTLRKLLCVGVHQQLGFGGSGGKPTNSVHLFKWISLRWALFIHSFNPPVSPQQKLVPINLSFFSFTFLFACENSYNPSVVSLLLTSICLSVFLSPLVYITLASLPLLRMCVRVCVNVGSVSAYFAYYFVKVREWAGVWMDGATMVAFQVNKQHWHVCLNVLDCLVLTEAECTFGYLFGPFTIYYPLIYPCSHTQRHHSASLC